MNILWLCNIPLPLISQHMGIQNSYLGGWMSGLANGIKKINDINLSICFPTYTGNKEIIKGEIERIRYYGFPNLKVGYNCYNDKLEQYLTDIINEVNPDIVHIFGTELPHSLAMTKVFNDPNRTVINIQGLCHVISKHYFAGLPENIIKKYTLRDFIKNDNIKSQKNKFQKRGLLEIRALKNTNHIIGRTTWDKACTFRINPNANYHFCNETLRDEFYNHKWDINSCERYSIFVSQGGYPVKGLHMILEAIPQVIKLYPNAHLYIAGQDITKQKTLKDKIKISSYGTYIRKLIDKYNLQDYITFTGGLDEKEMCERFLKSHVFVSASSIENSPNSVGEAMILGVPTISSDVGGVKDMLTHMNDGFIYQYDAPYMLAHHIIDIFKNDKLALEISNNSRKRASITHNREKNLQNMLNIYNCIYENISK